MKRGENDDREKIGSVLLQMDETGGCAQSVCAVCCHTGGGVGLGGIGGGTGNLRRFGKKKLTTAAYGAKNIANRYGIAYGCAFFSS